MDSLKEGGSGQFKGGRMVVTEVLILIEGGKVMLQRVTLMEREYPHYRSGHFNGGKMVMLLRWSV